LPESDTVSLTVNRNIVGLRMFPLRHRS